MRREEGTGGARSRGAMPRGPQGGGAPAHLQQRWATSGGRAARGRRCRICARRSTSGDGGVHRPAATEEQATCLEMLQGMEGRCVRPLSPQAAPPAMEEEDEVKEIECEESRPQAIHILRKRGEEVVVVEEEDTTREVKRLRFSFSMAMKQIEVSIASAVSVFGVGDYGLL